MFGCFFNFPSLLFPSSSHTKHNPPLHIIIIIIIIIIITSFVYFVTQKCVHHFSKIQHSNEANLLLQFSHSHNNNNFSILTIVIIMFDLPKLSIFTFCTSLFILFISYLYSHFTPNLHFQHPTNQSINLGPNPSAKSHQEHVISKKRHYIVRFLEYKNAQDHRIYLQESVRLEGWDWIDRNNPAAKYPTDFGLVAIDDLCRDLLIGKIEALELVKDVSVDLSYQREALGVKNEGDLLIQSIESLELVKDASVDLSYQREVFEEKREGGNGFEKVGAFVDGKKKPGKMFTAMSFGEMESDHYAVEDVSNMSVNWRRNLLMQVR